MRLPSGVLRRQVASAPGGSIFLKRWPRGAVGAHRTAFTLPEYRPSSGDRVFMKTSLNPSVVASAKMGFSQPGDPRDQRQLRERSQYLDDVILGSTWSDYVVLMQELCFWEVELGDLENLAAAFQEDLEEETANRLRNIQNMMDCLYRAIDVRDHAHELMEASSRSAGIAGTGINATEGVSNMTDHVEAISAEYDELLAKYPEFAPKIEETVGQMLALLRQKLRFEFSSQHQYFF